MQAVGLKTYIWNNNLRAAVLLAGFPVLLLALLWAGQVGLMGAGVMRTGGFGQAARLSTKLLFLTGPVALAAAAVWYTIAFFGHQDIIDATTGARRVRRAEEPELWNLLENLCISRGLPMPDLRIAETDALNAWASGLSEKRSVVTVTRGLMQTLNRDEMEAVLGHELTHIINRDARVMVIAAVFAGVITLIAELIARSILYSGGRGGRSREDRDSGAILVLIGLAAAALGYVLALGFRFALSRRREFVADAGSVELTKNPDAMISALLKIDGRSQIRAPDDIQAMFIDNHEEGLGAFFDTHPPIRQRVQALITYAHGRLPEPSGEPQAAPAETAVPVTRQTGTRPGPWG